MIAAIEAERIKLVSTRAPYWCLGIVVLLGLGVATLLGALFNGTTVAPDEIDSLAGDYLIGVTQFGVAVLAIMAVLGMTTEYRFGTIRLSFAAVPRRTELLAAKAAVFGVLTFVVVAVVGLVGVLAGQALSGHGIALGGPETVRQLWGTPVFATLCALIGLAVGALVRHSAGAVAIVLVWMLAAERIISVLPRIGDDVTSFLPFLNGWHFLGGSDDPDFHWNAYGSLVYFGVFTAGMLVLAAVVLNARDA